MGRVRPDLITLLMAATLATGCTSPGDALDLNQRSKLGASLAIAVTGDGTPAPSPGPAPKPTPSGERCDECGGTGVLGDGVIEIKCPVCNGTGKKGGGSAPAAAPKKTPVVVKTIQKPVRNARGRWSVTGRRSYDRAYIANHMQKTHGIDPTGYTKEDLQIMHDNVHEGYPALGRAVAKKTTSRSYRRGSCPGGRCP